MTRDKAAKLANKILDRHNADPDDDLAVLSRQLLRALEREGMLCEAILDLSDVRSPVGQARGKTKHAAALALAQAWMEKNNVRN